MSSDAPRRLGWKDVPARAPTTGRILIVEDHAEVRRAVERMVASLGYEVRSASSAEEADHWLSAERFDVMLLDVELPRMKGTEFLSWALERDGELAVIMLSGLDDPSVAIECIEKGARTYLVKPVEREFLRLGLRDAMAMRQLLVERNRNAT
jgi:DNA-binding NtrC family response regulator